MKNFDEKGVILSENIPGFRGNEPLNDILKFLDIDDSMPETRRYKNNVKGKTRRMKFKSRDFGNIKNKKKNKSKDVITEKKENKEKESCTVNDHEDFSKYGQNQETETKVCEDQNAADADTSSLPQFINSELVFKHTLENEFNNFYDLNDSSLKFDPADDSRDFKAVTPRKDEGKNYSVSRFNSPAHKNYKTGELCGSRMNNSTFNTSYVNNNLKFVPFYQLSSDSQNFLELKKYNSELSLKNEHSRLDNGVFYPGISGNNSSASRKLE